MTVYISIGNSDHRLSQSEWAQFVRDVDYLLSVPRVAARHGFWLSLPDDAYLNACWCVEAEGDASLKAALEELATQHRQDSIVWAEAVTTFLGPAGSDPSTEARSGWGGGTAA